MLIEPKDCKYFSCIWLSDYGNEQEYLFIQNNGYLQIENITHLSMGVELQSIVQCIQYMESSIDGVSIEMHRIILNKLISNEMNRQYPNTFQSAADIHPYANSIFHQFCVNKTKLNIYNHCFRNNRSFLAQYFMVEKFPKWEWIDLDFIYAIFPKLQCQVQERDNG